MKRQIQAFLATFLLAGGLVYLHAQQNPGTEEQTTTEQQQAPSAQPPAQRPGQSQPEQHPQAQPGTTDSQTSGAQGVRTFTGTIVKSGDKYVLQEESSGKTYDIDHQDAVAQHSGQRVRVNGVLDPSGKTIQLQPAKH